MRGDEDAEETKARFDFAQWRQFLRFSQTWGLLFARVISDPVWWFYLLWMPKYLTEGRGLTMIVDIFPRRVVASVHGIVATGGGIGGALFTTAAGYVIEWKSYPPLLVAMGLLHPLAYLCVRWLVRDEAVKITELKLAA